MSGREDAIEAVRLAYYAALEDAGEEYEAAVKQLAAVRDRALAAYNEAVRRAEAEE